MLAMLVTFAVFHEERSIELSTAIHKHLVHVFILGHVPLRDIKLGDLTAAAKSGVRALYVRGIPVRNIEGRELTTSIECA